MALILLVDDEPQIVSILEYKLKKLGHDVISTPDGDEVLKKIEENRPNLVLMDVMLPGMDGYQVLRKIKSDDRYKNIPVLMLTATGQEKDILRGFDIGADDYIVKPFSFPELLARIAKALVKGQPR